MKFIAIIIGLLFFMPSAGSLAADGALSPVPPYVLRMLEWPSPETINQKTVAPANNTVKTATYSTDRWLRIVIDPAWLPEKFDPLYLEGELGNMRGSKYIVRYKWESNGRSFIVAQTSTIFVLEIRPEEGKLRGKSTSERLERVREICGEVFIKTGERSTGQLEKVPILELNRRILDASFKIERTRVFTNQEVLLTGKAIDMHEAQVTTPETNERGRIENDKHNPDWFNTSFAWMYWFRTVNWFSDDERIVVYLLKSDGGPLALHW